MRSFALVCLFAAAAHSMPANNGQANDDGMLGTVIGVVNDCIDGDVTLCLKERALRYAEGLASARELSLADGVSLVGTGSPRSARALEPLSEEPRARESQVESRLIDSAADFLENHVLQFRLPTAAVDDVKRSLEEGRGKKKAKKALAPILLLLKLKFAALIPLFLAILAFTAVKALILGKVALLITGLMALKKLLAKSNQHESYEVVAHAPHHEEHGPSHGWGRSSQDAQDLAYAAHVKN